MRGFSTPLWDMPARKAGEYSANGKGWCDICKSSIRSGEMISKWLGHWSHSACKDNVTQVTHTARFFKA